MVYNLLGCYFYALLPLINLWSLNIEEVIFSEIMFLGGGLLLITSLIFFVFLYISYSSQKALLITYIFLFMFISCEHFFDGDAFLFRYLQKLGLSYIVLLPFWALIFLLVAYWIVSSRRNFKSINTILLLVASILFCYSLVGLVCRLDRETFSKEKVSLVPLKIKPLNKNLPDIYYIIVDAYSRNDILDAIYGYNNLSFIDFLKDNNFLIAKSYSNYHSTVKSLSSSLGMNYLNHLNSSVNPYSKDNLFLVSPFIKILKEHGYTIVHITAGEGFTSYNPAANFNFNVPRYTYFSLAFLNKTFFGPFSRKFGVPLYLDYRKKMNSLNELKAVVESFSIKGPKFVFCHLLCPHVPFVMNKEGTYSPVSKIDSFNQIQHYYTEQVQGLNKYLIPIIKELLKNENALPVVIIQGDHGNHFLPKNSVDSGTEGLSVPLEVKIRFANLNAYFLPQIKSYRCPFYESITPVNSFRLILNYYFDTNFQLLEDRIIYDQFKDKYEFSVSELNGLSMKGAVEKLKKTTHNYLHRIGRKNVAMEN